MQLQQQNVDWKKMAELNKKLLLTAEELDTIKNFTWNGRSIRFILLIILISNL